MTPEFAAVVKPHLKYVLDLVSRINSGQSVNLEAEKAKISSLLDRVRQASVRNEKDYPEKSSTFNLAYQGLIYWTDEVLTNADENWEEIILERTLLNTRSRAESFYVLGETKARKSSPDVKELWYLLLVLGFGGAISNAFAKMPQRRDFPPVGVDDEAARQLWAKELERELDFGQSDLAELTKPPLKGDVRPLHGISFLVTTVSVLGFTLLICLLLSALLYSR